MRPHLSLSVQVLTLVTLPLIVQLGSLVWLASLQNEWDRDLKVAARAGRISDTINALCADVYEAMTKYGSEKDSYQAPELFVFEDLERKFHSHYETLKKLTSDKPDEYALVVRADKSAHTTIQWLKKIKESIDRGGEEERLSRKAMWRQVREGANNLLDKDLIDLGANQKRLLERSPEVQAQIRQQIQNTMLFAGVVNLLLTLLAATFFTRGIAGKIKRLNDNTYRLASDLPLHPVLEGQDELSSLDSVFHKMALELKESARKERALVDNARDLICSITEAGRFLAINPACKTLLDYDPEELLGSHLVDLIAATDASKTLAYFESIKETGDTNPLEIALRKKNGAGVDVLLSAHYSKEEQSFFCVVHDITERKQAEKLRQEVVAMVTHDLRTPLGTVKNILDFLEGGSFGTLDEKGTRYITSGQRNVDRMMTLINDLLDVEKISSGRMELELEDVSLNECFNSCLDLHGGQAEEMGVKLVAEPTKIIVEADAEKLQRVMSNLISNAIKFSPRDGTVSIEAKNNGSHVLISVQDEGPGIPDDQLESVFERFHQVADTSKKVGGGSGLGLAICKAIAELHGGSISVQSELGKGSKFTVALLRID